MANVLAGHEMENSPVIRGEGYTRCSCGFLSKGAYSRAAHSRHVEGALSAAGFGPVQEAQYSAWAKGLEFGMWTDIDMASDPYAAHEKNPYRKDQP